MNKKILLIVNPKAGKEKIKRKVPRIVRNFSKEGYSVKTIYTQRDYKPDQIIKDEKTKYDLIVCCGGDGTLNELINGVMKLEEKPNISFVPLGTMNDFARTIKMSRKKLFLSKHISNARIIPSDIGKFNDKYFNYVAAFGAFTPVSYVTPHSLKRLVGKIAYFIVGVIYIGKMKSYKLKITVDDNEIEDEFIYGSISNSKSVGGFQWFKRRGVQIDDGKFEMLFIKKPKNIFAWINTLILLAFRKHFSRYFYFFQTDNIKMEAEYQITWTIDGEYGGRNKEVEISNINKAIKFVIPL